MRMCDERLATNNVNNGTVLFYEDTKENQKNIN
jgi:hypothetical protein